jgi:hypothetical protein
VRAIALISIKRRAVPSGMAYLYPRAFTLSNYNRFRFGFFITPIWLGVVGVVCKDLVVRM